MDEPFLSLIWSFCCWTDAELCRCRFETYLSVFVRVAL